MRLHLRFSVEPNRIMAVRENLKDIDPEVRIKHKHLKVSDLQRSIHFNCGVMGLEITQRYGSQAVFIPVGRKLQRSNSAEGIWNKPTTCFGRYLFPDFSRVDKSVKSAI